MIINDFNFIALYVRYKDAHQKSNQTAPSTFK
jgi:hypothetical protein